ncbi:MAG: hypothetical protein V1494_01825 [Candidatus Diapherotrites archaeon]
MDRKSALALSGAYEHPTAGNIAAHKDRQFAGLVQAAFNPEHPGTHLGVIGHHGSCLGMKLTSDALALIRSGKSPTSLFEHKQFGTLYKQVGGSLHEYEPFLAAVEQVHGPEFLTRPEFQVALEEFNVFLQLSNIVRREDFQALEKDIIKSHNNKITLVAGIYTPKEKMVEGALSPVQGRMEFKYDKLANAVGGIKNLHKLLKELRLRHEPGNPIIQRLK